MDCIFWNSYCGCFFPSGKEEGVLGAVFILATIALIPYYFGFRFKRSLPAAPAAVGLLAPDAGLLNEKTSNRLVVSLKKILTSKPFAITWIIFLLPIILISIFKTEQINNGAAPLISVALIFITFHYAFFKPRKLLKLRKKEAEKAELYKFYSEFEATLQELDEAAIEDFPRLDTKQEGYRPVGKEELIALQDDVFLAEIKGPEKKAHMIAQGRMIITTAALAFESNSKNERLIWDQIVKADTTTDIIEVYRRSGPSRLYGVSDLSPKFAATLQAMLKI